MPGRRGRHSKKAEPDVSAESEDDVQKEAPTAEELAELTVRVLKSKLKKLGLGVGGKKSVLIERLLEHYEDLSKGIEEKEEEAEEAQEEAKEASAEEESAAEGEEESKDAEQEETPEGEEGEGNDVDFMKDILTDPNEPLELTEDLKDSQPEATPKKGKKAKTKSPSPKAAPKAATTADTKKRKREEDSTGPKKKKPRSAMAERCKAEAANLPGLKVATTKCSLESEEVMALVESGIDVLCVRCKSVSGGPDADLVATFKEKGFIVRSPGKRQDWPYLLYSTKLHQNIGATRTDEFRLFVEFVFPSPRMNVVLIASSINSFAKNKIGHLKDETGYKNRLATHFARIIVFMPAGPPMQTTASNAMYPMDSVTPHALLLPVSVNKEKIHGRENSLVKAMKKAEHEHGYVLTEGEALHACPLSEMLPNSCSYQFEATALFEHPRRHRLKQAAQAMYRVGHLARTSGKNTLVSVTRRLPTGWASSLRKLDQDVRKGVLPCLSTDSAGELLKALQKGSNSMTREWWQEHANALRVLNETGLKEGEQEEATMVAVEGERMFAKWVADPSLMKVLPMKKGETAKRSRDRRVRPSKHRTASGTRSSRDREPRGDRDRSRGSAPRSVRSGAGRGPVSSYVAPVSRGHQSMGAPAQVVGRGSGARGRRERDDWAQSQRGRAGGSSRITDGRGGVTSTHRHNRRSSNEGSWAGGSSGRATPRNTWIQAGEVVAASRSRMNESFGSSSGRSAHRDNARDSLGSRDIGSGYGGSGYGGGGAGYGGRRESYGQSGSSHGRGSDLYQHGGARGTEVYGGGAGGDTYGRGADHGRGNYGRGVEPAFARGGGGGLPMGGDGGGRDPFRGQGLAGGYGGGGRSDVPAQPSAMICRFYGSQKGCRMGVECPNIHPVHVKPVASCDRVFAVTGL